MRLWEAQPTLQELSFTLSLSHLLVSNLSFSMYVCFISSANWLLYLLVGLHATKAVPNSGPSSPPLASTQFAQLSCLATHSDYLTQFPSPYSKFPGAVIWLVQFQHACRSGFSKLTPLPSRGRGVGGKSGLPSTFVNKVLTKHSHTFIYILSLAALTLQGIVE